MHESGFDQIDSHGVRGLRRPVIPVRHLLHRLLRPVFLRLAERFQHLGARLDAHERELAALRGEVGKLTGQMQATLAFGWDYAALVRRLAVLEDLVARQADPWAHSSSPSETQPLVLFPGLEKARNGEALHALKRGAIPECDARPDAMVP
jgi:hypothetical protein